MEIFMSEHVQELLHNKFVVIIGDSIQRSVYKDLVTLLQSNAYTAEKELKTKGERSHRGDTLIEGGELEEMNNRKSYREVRQWQHPYHLLRFYFVTRCYSEYMETILLDLSKKPQPDVVIMNSCLWDITRYGPSSMRQYEKNLQLLFRRFDEVLPKESLIMWLTTMPIAEKIRGGFLIEQISFMNDVLRLDAMVANFYAAQVVKDHNHDVLDLHYHFRHMLSHRKKDGVHWDAKVHRRMTNVILSHVCQAWHIKLPKFTAEHQRKQEEEQKAASEAQQNWNKPGLHSNFSDSNNNNMASGYRNSGLSEEEERYGGPIRHVRYHQRSDSAPSYVHFSVQNQQQLAHLREQQLYIQQQHHEYQRQRLVQATAIALTNIVQNELGNREWDRRQANWQQQQAPRGHRRHHHRAHPYY